MFFINIYSLLTFPDHLVEGVTKRKSTKRREKVEGKIEGSHKYAKLLFNLSNGKNKLCKDMESTCRSDAKFTVAILL